MSTLGPQLMKHVGRLTHVAQQHYYNVQDQLVTTLQNTDIKPKAALYAALLCIILVWVTFAATHRIRHRKRNSAQPSTPNLEKRGLSKAHDRPFGGMSHIITIIT
jgi:hypothetical protein